MGSLLLPSNSAHPTTALPLEQTLIEAGKDVLKSTKSWKPGKTFSNTKGDTPYHVKISSRPREQGDEAGWHSRYSEHREGTFDEFWERLGRNKAINEKEYVQISSTLEAPNPSAGIFQKSRRQLYCRRYRPHNRSGHYTTSSLLQFQTGSSQCFKRCI